MTSKKTYTSGPWEVTRQTGVYWGVSKVGDYQNGAIAWATVAKVSSETNARLIACAPMLLENLKHTLSALRTVIKDPDSWQTVINAQLSIDKAEGK